jgi:hypothetical protein
MDKSSFEGVRAVVSKRGVDDGNQKGGGSLQPAKENQIYYNKNKNFVNKNFKNSKFFIFILTQPLFFYNKFVRAV